MRVLPTLSQAVIAPVVIEGTATLSTERYQVSEGSMRSSTKSFRGNTVLAVIGLGLLISGWVGCSSGSSSSGTPVKPTNYVLTVNSLNPTTGVTIEVTPVDASGTGNGATSFTRTYAAGTSVTLTAPVTAGTDTFISWTGCTNASTFTCTVVMGTGTTVTANYQAPPAYTLTVNSANPTGGVAISAAPADNNGSSGGTTGFILTYNAGTTVTLAAAAMSDSNSFASWTGCNTATIVTCNVIMNGNKTVTASYNAPTIQSVTVGQNQAMTIGSSQQFTATVTGTGDYSKAVTWSLNGSSGSTQSPGTLSASGLYTTPYPAPANVMITATSVQDSTKSGSVMVNLTAPAAATGPALSVDAGNQTHAISPYIYGMNNYQLDYSMARAANITIDRFGGDATSRYNYLLDVSSSAADFYFENFTGATGQEDLSQFNTQVNNDTGSGIRTLGTVNVLGWVAKDGTSCSFPVLLYPNQYAVEPYHDCGDGETSTQTDITGNDPTLTSITSGPAFAGGWVSYLAGKFGSAANGGVAIYDLDNEPSNWDSMHRDVHPLPFTYDELTNNGIATAKAIKAADPTAEVSGPVMDSWMNYFYSKRDVESGWSTGPCYQPWSNPVDRNAHGGVPFIEYYLKQFAAYQAANNTRLLDYVDLHTYFTASYQGATLSSAPAGDTGAQQARLNSTRVLWDPTYTDPAYTQPNYSTDANYTAKCTPPAQAPQLIPLMQRWVKNDYPGTKTAITEYNWGGQESINGALAQADILGIFGSYGLDVGVLWGAPNASSQVPGLMAFEMYRNYDGNNSLFGNEALASSSANQGSLSVYGALRTADNSVTVVVINKTYGDLTSTLSLANLTPSGTAQAYLYISANLAAIVAKGAVTVAPPVAGGTTSTLSTTFPAQSITLFIIPKK
jgi:hypothetical protein